jgi:hypothetical protein
VLLRLLPVQQFPHHQEHHHQLELQVVHAHNAHDSNEQGKRQRTRGRIIQMPLLQWNVLNCPCIVAHAFLLFNHYLSIVSSTTQKVRDVSMTQNTLKNCLCCSSGVGDIHFAVAQTDEQKARVLYSAHGVSNADTVFKLIVDNIQEGKYVELTDACRRVM